MHELGAEAGARGVAFNLAEVKGQALILDVDDDAVGSGAHGDAAFAGLAGVVGVLDDVEAGFFGYELEALRGFSGEARAGGGDLYELKGGGEVGGFCGDGEGGDGWRVHWGGEF